MWKINEATGLSEYHPMSIEDYAPSEMNPCPPPYVESEKERAERLWKAVVASSHS